MSESTKPREFPQTIYKEFKDKGLYIWEFTDGISLDGDFELEDLEKIVQLMKEKQEQKDV